MQVYRAEMRLWEHVYFASREIGILYETEPLIGNYALAYALGLARAPYRWGGGPRYKEDLTPLNEAGIYVTPATFDPENLSFTITQFNAQADSYFYRFDQNAISTDRTKKSRAANFPQQGRIRMLGMGSTATFYLLADEEKGASAMLEKLGVHLSRRMYVRLGKFNSKVQVDWTRVGATYVEAEEQSVAFMLNPADMPSSARLVPLSVYYVHPTPLLAHSLVSSGFWQLEYGKDTIMLPAGMRFGVEQL